MNSKKSRLTIALLVLCLIGTAGSASATLLYDQDVTAYYGSGNGPEDWTVWSEDDIELALRTHQRFPTPDNIQNSNSDGTYSWDTGSGTFSWGAVGPIWNFDWSVQLPSADVLNGYTYEMGIDFDASGNTDFLAFDLINLPSADHALRDASGAVTAGSSDPSTYSAQLASNNGAQNSWNMAFFTHPTLTFDPDAVGTYDIYLSIYNDDGGELGRTEIQVLVGGGAPPVPEPATIGLLGLGLAGLAVRSRNKRA